MKTHLFVLAVSFVFLGANAHAAKCLIEEQREGQPYTVAGVIDMKATVGLTKGVYSKSSPPKEAAVSWQNSHLLVSCQSARTAIVGEVIGCDKTYDVYAEAIGCVMLNKVGKGAQSVSGLAQLSAEIAVNDSLSYRLRCLTWNNSELTTLIDNDENFKNAIELMKKP